MFSDVMQEAAEKTGREIIASEARLVEEFKKKGNNVIVVDKNAFREGRAQEHQADRPRLPPAGLRPDHRHPVKPRAAGRHGRPPLHDNEETR